jgi:multiple sugar transport system permease protein
MATVAESAVPRRRARTWEVLPYWLILPALAYLALFFAWPMIQSFSLAFREDGHWTLAPFNRMLDDQEFGDSLRFTLLFVLVIVPIQFVLAIAMALLVNAKIRGQGLFLYIFLLPLAISDLAAGIVWVSIFTEFGYLNTALEGIGVISRPEIWLDPTREHYLLGVVVVAEVWRSTALMTLIVVAGLQGIPRDYTEAAEVFGAGFFRRIWHVTLPMLKPALQVAVLLRVIFAFEAFAVVVALTGAGASVLAEEAYRQQTEAFDDNVAAAYASLIIVLSLVSAAIVLRALRTPREQLLR